MPDNQRRKQYSYLFGIFVVAYIIYLILFEIQGAEDIKEGLSHFFMGIMLYAVYTYVIMHNEKFFELAGRRMRGMYVSSVITCILLILSVCFPIYQLWLTGCIIMAVVYGIYPGIASLIVYTGIFGICNELPFSGFLLYLIPGAVIIILTSFYPKNAGLKLVAVSYLYSLIISVSCHVSMYMIINELDIHKLFCFESVMMIIYTFIIITAVYAYMLFISGRQNGNEDIIESNNTDNDLMDRLKETQPAVYRHSVIVAKLSGLAAEAIGADADIAAMGAMYHEIGKITGKEDYVAEGVALAAEYKLPDYVVNVIESHTHESAVPLSKEAAVVYFSIIIVNSVKHMMSAGDKEALSTEALIENIFRLRLRDGFLNDSGLTIFEYNSLKEFFIEYFAEKS